MLKLFHYRYVLLLLLFSLLLSLSFYTTNHFFNFYEEGQVADSDIVSPATETFEDEEETEEKREEHLANVQEVYELNPAIQTEQVDKWTVFIQSLQEAQREYERAIDEAEEEDTEPTVALSDFQSTVENTYQLEEEEIQQLLETPRSDLNQMEEVFENEIEKFYDTNIPADELEEAIGVFENNSSFYFFDREVRHIVLDGITSNMEHNFEFNEYETSRNKQEAERNFSPVTKTIQTNEVIVRQGEEITEEHIRIMQEVGLLYDDSTWMEMFERFPFILFLMMSFHLFLYRFNQKEIQHLRLYFFLFTVTLVATLLSNFFQNDYVTMTLMVAAIILITNFLNPSLSVLYSIVLGFLIQPGDYTFLLMSFILGIVQTLGHNPQGNRTTFKHLGYAMAATLVITYAGLSLVLSIPFEGSDYLPLLVGPIAGSIVAIGLFPYLEGSLGTVTSLKLHELSSRNHKLLKRLFDEAPGTYHHSEKVASLSESAAEAVGANGLLLRVASLYHDVGKLASPLHFIENTTSNRNPHQFLTPRESAAYIRNHAPDSVKLCKKHNIPPQIIELIEKHHGDSLVEHFYNTAIKHDGEADEKAFRYLTPPPETKEEGILMLADITEAYSRVILEEPVEVFEQKLRALIYKTIEQGDLRKCSLTLKDIETIIRVFTESLLRSNHKRTEYEKS